MFFRKLIQSFAKACKNGFKGFIEWIRSLLKTEGKHLDEVLDTNKYLDDIENYLTLRKEFHNSELIEKLWREKITNKLLFPNSLKKLYFKYLDNYPALKRGFNQAEFKTTIKSKGNLIEEIEEFSISGDQNKLALFGNPPKLPPNTIDVIDDWDNFEKFVKGAVDFRNRPRNYDIEIKYIFNFLKKHVDKGDEFVIETKNIFKTCGSCRRELVMLEEYLKSKGKKVKIIMLSDETIEGTAHLKKKLKIK